MKRDGAELQLAAINAIFRCGFVRGGAHSAMLIECGAFARMLELMRSPDVHVRGRATVVVGNVLYGVPEQIDVAFQAGVLPLVLADIALGELMEPFEDPRSFLASVAYGANAAQLRVLLRAGALPLLRSYVHVYNADSLRKTASVRDALEGKYVRELLQALGNMLRAEAEDSGDDETPAHEQPKQEKKPEAKKSEAHSSVESELDDRAEVQPLLDHWSALVRDEAAKFLREHC